LCIQPNSRPVAGEYRYSWVTRHDALFDYTDQVVNSASFGGTVLTTLFASRSQRVSLIVVPGCLFVCLFVAMFVCPRQRTVLRSSAATQQQQAAV